MLKDALLSTFIQVVLPVLATGLTAVLTWVFAQLALKLGTQKGASKLALVGEKAFHFAQVVVAELDATLKPKLQEMSADGVLTAAEIGQLRDIALNRIKELLAERGLKELQNVLGLVGPQLDVYLRGLLERAVDLKNAAAPVKISGMTLQTSANESVAEALGNLPPSSP